MDGGQIEMKMNCLRALANFSQSEMKWSELVRGTPHGRSIDNGYLPKTRFYNGFSAVAQDLTCWLKASTVALLHHITLGHCARCMRPSSRDIDAHFHNLLLAFCVSLHLLHQRVAKKRIVAARPKRTRQFFFCCCFWVIKFSRSINTFVNCTRGQIAHCKSNKTLQQRNQKEYIIIRSLARWYCNLIHSIWTDGRQTTFFNWRQSQAPAKGYLSMMI